MSQDGIGTGNTLSSPFCDLCFDTSLCGCVYICVCMTFGEIKLPH